MGPKHVCLFDIDGTLISSGGAAREALAEVRARFNGTVAAERIWVIGDTPLDIRCARAIGAKAVAVVTGWHERAELEAHEPDLLLMDLQDSHPLLRCWGLD